MLGLHSINQSLNQSINQLINHDRPLGPSLSSLPTPLPGGQFDAHGLLRQAARRCAAPSASPIPAAPLWASGFSFSWARPVLEACPYDPRLRHLFFGEEGSMAAR